MWMILKELDKLFILNLLESKENKLIVTLYMIRCPPRLKKNMYLKLQEWSWALKMNLSLWK